MQSPAIFSTLAVNLRASYGPLEKSFSLAGRELERAAGALGSLGPRFGALEAELSDPALGAALSSLDHAASSVRSIEGIIRAERQALERMQGQLHAIGGHLGQLDGTVRAVGMLTVTAKVCASGLGAMGEDFTAFTSEIARLFELSSSSLQEFQQVVARLLEKLQAGLAQQDSFARQQAEALQTIPAALTESALLLEQRLRAGAAASGQVGARSAAVARALSEAIMALQVADATRQRVQHVEEAVALLPGLLAQGHIGLEERRLLRAHICHLQGALLGHAAEEHAAETQRVDTALHSLGQDARAILALGTEVYGGQERRGGALGTMETNVRHALGLLREFRAAKAEMTAMAADIIHSVLQLSGHIGTVQGLETDLRLMSLNMTLKSGRLHEAGRTLHTIARELRSCADQTTQIVALVTRDLSSITEGAQAHANRRQPPEEQALEELDTLMANAMATLGGTGKQIAAALAALEESAGSATSALGAARGRLNETGLLPVLKRLEQELVGQAGGPALTGADVSRISPLLPASLSSRFTMASERSIQAKLTGTAGTTSGPANETLEDILF